MSTHGFCGKCGTALPAGTRFCGRCGAAAAGPSHGAAERVVSTPAPTEVTGSAPRRRRALPIIAIVVAGLAISGVSAAVIGVLPRLSGNTALAAVGMQLPRPAGWEEAQSEYGQVIALLEADLVAGAPQGPRIQVRPAELYGTAALWEADISEAGSVAIREGPTPITVGSPGREGVEVLTEEGSAGAAGGAAVIKRYVIVTLEDGRAVLITMEAPADRFDSYRTAFDGALQNASFAP